MGAHQAYFSSHDGTLSLFSVADCEGRCLNGGVCTTDGVLPGCKCPEEYGGEFCEKGKLF